MTCAYQTSSLAVDMETVIDNLPSAVIVVDRDRRVLLANKQAAVLAHKSKAEFFGLRGGEAFGCVNSAKVAEGCGFAPECEFCMVRGTVMGTFAERRGRIGVESELTVTGMIRIPVRVSTNLSSHKTGSWSFSPSRISANRGSRTRFDSKTHA